MPWNIKEALEYFREQGAPSNQNALIQLLREIQQENGGRIPKYLLQDVAAYYGIKEGILLALIKRIPSLRLGDTHCLELCAGPNCGKNKALADYAEKLHRDSGGSFELKFVPCMRLCGKGPNVRWDGKIYHQMTQQKLKDLVK